MKSSRLLLALLVVLSLSTGCGTFRYVQRSPSGGTIALPLRTESAMRNARQAMAEHCGPRFTIVQEEEAVTGQITTGNAISTNDPNQQTSSGYSTSANTTEWRLTYRCESGR